MKTVFMWNGQFSFQNAFYDNVIEYLLFILTAKWIQKQTSNVLPETKSTIIISPFNRASVNTYYITCSR